MCPPILFHRSESLLHTPPDGHNKICTGRTPDSDPVAAKTEPAYIFHNAVGHTVDRIYAPHIFRCHDIGSLMSAVAAKSPALHPAIFKYNVIFRFSCDLSHRKTQKVTPDAFDISVYLCKFIATIFFASATCFFNSLGSVIWQSDAKYIVKSSQNHSISDPALLKKVLT